MTTRSDPTPDDLLAAARVHGLRLTTEQRELDASGLDFLVLHAEDDAGVRWILRAPRRPDVIESAEREARVLRLVRSILPVAVPDWRIHAPELIAYPRLPGTPAWSLGADGALTWALDATAPSDDFLDSYAEAIAALSTIDAERATRAGLRVQTIDEARAEVARAMDDARAPLDPPASVWARWQRWIEDDATWPTRSALVHGDLHPGHLLLDERGRVGGILDWTEARVSDPSIDLALFFGCFGRGALEAAVSRSAQNGGVTWPGIVEHTIERWAAYSALVAAYALKVGSEPVMEHARGHLRAIASETS